MLASFVAVSSSLPTCGEVKDLYRSSACCGASGSKPVGCDATGNTPTTPHFGFPNCYVTFHDPVHGQYAVNEMHNYLPALDGYVAVPYSFANVSSCRNVPRAVYQTVAHASPMGLMRVDATKDTSLPKGTHNMVIVALTGSWNRPFGNETGYTYDSFYLGYDDAGRLSATETAHFAPAAFTLGSNQGSPAYTASFRPIDMIQAFGRTWTTTKSGGGFAGLSRVVYDAESGAVALDPAAAFPCARRLAAASAYLYITQSAFFCSGKNWGAELGSGVVSMVKPDRPFEGRDLLGNLLNPDGLVVHNDVLYVATSNDANTELGNRIVRVQNLRAQTDAKWAEPSYNMVVDTMVNFNHLQGWHPFATLGLSPDGKFLLAGRGNACDNGCSGALKAVEIATRKVFVVADGLRNPVGVLAYDSETVLISDMGSDGGYGTTQFVETFGKNGPSDRIVAVKWTTPTVEYVPPACVDDPNNVLSYATALYADVTKLYDEPMDVDGCAELVASLTCAGSFLFPGFEFFQISVAVATECPQTCGACPGPVTYS